jgi:preprotein translocase subunit SecY
MKTEKGIGNGVSMIIFAGIISRLPGAVKEIYEDYFVNIESSRIWQSVIFIAILVIAKREIIPAKIIIETPFPIPFSVICSPIQVTNIVPAVKITAIITKVVNNPTLGTFVMIAVILTAGTMFVTWMGNIVPAVKITAIITKVPKVGLLTIPV